MSWLAVTQRLAQAPLDGDAWFARSMLVLQKGDQDGWDEFIDAIQGCVGAVGGAAVPSGHRAGVRRQATRALSPPCAWGKLREHLKTASESALQRLRRPAVHVAVLPDGSGCDGRRRREGRAASPVVRPGSPTWCRCCRGGHSSSEEAPERGSAEPERPSMARRIPRWAEAHRDPLVQLANRSAGLAAMGVVAVLRRPAQGRSSRVGLRALHPGRLKAEQSKSWDEALQSHEQARRPRRCAHSPGLPRPRPCGGQRPERASQGAAGQVLLQSSLASKSVKGTRRAR